MRSLNVAGALLLVEAGFLISMFPVNLVLLPLAGLSFGLSRRNPRHGNVIGIVAILAALVAFGVVEAIALTSSVVGGMGIL